MARLFLLSVLVGLAVADVTVSIDDVEPLPFEAEHAATSAEDLFRGSCPEEAAEGTGYSLLLSSYDGVGFPQAQAQSHSQLQTHSQSQPQPRALAFPSSDGFIRGAVGAWARHEHIVLRPDEVWFAVLAQLNLYMAVHSEDVRGVFVTHEGTEDVHVGAASWREVLAAFGGEVQRRVKTAWLADWISPGFSTSTPDDETTAAVLMMGLMRHYYEFSGSVVCGIPRVTLLGERRDWVRLLGKLDRLGDWGREPRGYAERLRPILGRFVKTWDEPDGEEVRAFWRRIVRADKVFSCGEGPSEYEVSGWITGFLHWKRDGGLRVPEEEDDDEDDDEGDEQHEGVGESSNMVTLDGIVYVPELLDDLGVGYARAPLKMVDFPVEGENTTAWVVAGNVAVLKRVDEKGEVRAQPSSAWFMYVPGEGHVDVAGSFGSWDELMRLYGELGVCKRGDVGEL